MELVVYYGTPSGVWIYLDGQKMSPEMASRALIRGKFSCWENTGRRDQPIGLFDPIGFTFMPEKGGLYQYGEEGPGLPPIDYDAINPNALKQRLEGRLTAVKDHIIEGYIKIECIKASPPN